jgi:hypothetical protein
VKHWHPSQLLYRLVCGRIVLCWSNASLQLLDSAAALREEAQAHAAAALASLCHLKPACEQLDSRVPQAIAAVSEFGQQCAPLCLLLLRMLSLESSRDRAVEQGLLPICSRILREATDAHVISLCAQIVFRATIPSAYKTLALQAGVLQVRLWALNYTKIVIYLLCWPHGCDSAVSYPASVAR